MSRTIPFAERLLAESAVAQKDSPFITVAIPHYNRRRYLEIVLDSLFAQTSRDFEILISDDGSQDDSNEVVPELLQKSGRNFRYYAQPVNLGYDGNVRFCLTVAHGRYVFLLGNDDTLAGPETLGRVAELLRELKCPEVCFTNYGDWGSDNVVRRALSTKLVGKGAAGAISHFRSFSFVSGLIYEHSAVVQHETDRWDQSIYYQIYIACRILAKGGRLGALDLCAVRKNVQIDQQTVPDYLSKWGNEPWSLQPRHSGLDSVIRVTADAVLPLVPKNERSSILRNIVTKVLVSTYPFWLFEYRRVSNWSFAAGIARDMWPGKLLLEYKAKDLLAWRDRCALWLIYLAISSAGLLIPIGVLKRIRNRLADFFRRRQQSYTSAVHS